MDGWIWAATSPGGTIGSTLAADANNLYVLYDFDNGGDPELYQYRGRQYGI
ncbi:MAG: hypothetical protein U0176_15515 [Bacteroidia bacterium]